MLNNNSKSRFNFIALIMSLLLLFAAVVSFSGATAGNISTSAKASETDSVELYAGAKTVVNTDLRGGQETFVSQTVTATISPSTVADKYVTWSLAWASDAPLKDADISEYLEVTEESQGELTATINCYKAFRNSKAILTCITRQGNKTATCEVVYDGVPSSMSITKVDGIGQFDLGNKVVDILYIGTSYPFTVTADNIFHDAGNGFSDYVVTISGVGTVTCGNYSMSPRGAGWGSLNNTVNFADIASEFITASVNDNVITVTPNKAFYEYYESSHTNYVEGNGQTTTYVNKLYSLNTDENGNLPYFIMTVRHRTLNFSQQYEFYIGETVNSVALNSARVTF